MYNKLIIGFIFFFFLFIFIPTAVHAESGQLYKVDSSVELRGVPEPNATIIAELESGDEITVFQQSFGWGRTFYNGQEAWVPLYRLALVGEEMESNHVEKSVVNEKEDHEKAPSGSETKVESEESEATSSLKDAENEDNYQDQSDKKALSGYHIVIDPGHGGKDRGAIRSDLYEKTLTLPTAIEVAKRLRNEGASVTLTRTDDTYISLDERVRISDSNDADALISLHYNAFTDQAVSGINTHYYAGDEAQKLASSIQTSLIKYVQLNDRGVRTGNYHILRESSDPAILIELGFMSNPDERETIQTTTYQKKVADAITAGVEDYFEG